MLSISEQMNSLSSHSLYIRNGRLSMRKLSEVCDFAMETRRRSRDDPEAEKKRMIQIMQKDEGQKAWKARGRRMQCSGRSSEH